MLSFRFLILVLLLSCCVVASFDTSLGVKKLSDLSFGLSWEPYIDGTTDNEYVYTIERWMEDDEGELKFTSFYVTKDTFAELFLSAGEGYLFRVCISTELRVLLCTNEVDAIETPSSDDLTFVPVDSNHIMISWNSLDNEEIVTEDVEIFREGEWIYLFTQIGKSSTSPLSVTSGRPDLYRISSGTQHSASQFYTPPSTVYGDDLPGIIVVRYDGRYEQLESSPTTEISMYDRLSPTASLIASFEFEPESLPCKLHSARLLIQPVHSGLSTPQESGEGFIRSFGEYTPKRSTGTATPIDPNFYLSSLSTQYDFNANQEFIPINLDHVISGTNGTATIESWESASDAELLLQLTDTNTGKLELTPVVTLEVAYEIVYPEPLASLPLTVAFANQTDNVCVFTFTPPSDVLISSVDVSLALVSEVVSTYITVGVGSYAVGGEQISDNGVTFSSPDYPLQTGGFDVSSGVIFVNIEDNEDDEDTDTVCPEKVELTVYSVIVGEEGEHSCARGPDPSVSPSPTPTNSPSPSRSRSTFPSSTRSASATRSVSESSSTTPSTTPSRSPSTSISNAVSASTSPSLTSTRTASSSISKSPSSSPTSPASESRTPSVSVSPTPSRSGSTAPSTSPVSSVDILPPLPSFSPSISPVPSSSISLAPTFVIIRTASPSASPTPSASGFAQIVPTVVPLAKEPISIPSGDGELVVTVELGPQGSPGEVLLVEPVDVADVPDMADIRSAIVSLVLNDAQGNELQPEGSVELCFVSTEDTSNQCLGFLDETAFPARWRCQDPCLETNSEGLVCGETDHFTSFALLLNGGAGKGCGSSNDYIFDEFYQDTILITSFTALVLCLAILALLFLALTPCGSRIVKGKEGHRIWKLRQSTLVTDHDTITPPQDLDLEV